MRENGRVCVVFELYGTVAQTAGCALAQVELLPGATVDGAVEALIHDHPQLRGALLVAMIAVDGVMVRRDVVLKGGETLMVVAMVSGG